MEPLSILALQNIPRIGNVTLRKISSLPNIVEPENSRELYEVLNEAKLNFNRIPNLDFSIVDAAWNKAIEIIHFSEENDIKIIGRNSPYYPSLLSKIDNPPELLHIKGNIEVLKEKCVAIIGTRNPTEDGICMAKSSGEKLAQNGYAIVSGLAKGIDAAAHEGALKANGKTLAVLAHGLHTIYPKQNKNLADDIIENNGVLISEYFWGKKSTKSSFVERDRIQSGLSLSVLVIETVEKGGTMHTVKYCTDQNRLLAVFEPPITSSSIQHYSGNYKLITNKLADFILKCDSKSFNCFFTYNYFKDSALTPEQDNFKKYKSFIEQKNFNTEFLKSYFIQLPHNSTDASLVEPKYDVALVKNKLQHKLKNNSSVHFTELILNMSFSFMKECETCKHFNECKLIDQGFSELCPFKKKVQDETPTQKQIRSKRDKAITSY